MQLIMGNISMGGDGGGMDDLFSVMDDGGDDKNAIRMNDGFSGGLVIKGQDIEGQV